MGAKEPIYLHPPIAEAPNSTQCELGKLDRMKLESSVSSLMEQPMPSGVLGVGVAIVIESPEVIVTAVFNSVREHVASGK